MEATAERLAARTLELVNIPSVSGNEEALADHVAGAVPLPLELRDEDVLLFAERRRGRPLVLLAGHLDTVPAQDNIPGQLDENAVIGLGASDMKGGLAVMVELARWIAAERPPLELDLALLFFGNEELPPSQSSIPRAFAGAPTLRDAELVVVLEPTDNTVQAGCLGNLNARLVFRGESAHSARPWLGVNAIEKAADALSSIFPVPRHEVLVAGLPFYEVVSPTRITGGVAQNVVPDRVEVDLNFRYAPSRTPAEAGVRLRKLIGAAVELEVLSNAPPAPVAAQAPLVRALRAAGGFSVQPKQAWTPVAEFAAEGLDAVNLGPGATRFAHRRDERVEIAGLTRTYEGLQRFLLEGTRPVGV